MNIAGTLELGDMLVQPGHYPAKLLKALAIVADRLHAEYAAEPWIKSPEWSKRSCVLTSLTVRDFLIALGFKAQVRSVCVIMNVIEGGEETYSAGIGAPDRVYARKYPDEGLGAPGFWNGHLVVILPREHVLIDTTLYPVIDRPAWAGLAPAMTALPIKTNEPAGRLLGMRVITGAAVTDDRGREFTMAWLDRPDNVAWSNGGDSKRGRRMRVVTAMVKRFGSWDNQTQ